MNGEYLELSYWQVGSAAVLVLINVAISLMLQLGLARSLVIASLRMVVQLLLVGAVLKWVFELKEWYAVVALMSFMTVVAGVAAVQRADHRYSGIFLDGIVSIWASSWLVTAMALLAIVPAEPWYLPQYSIPLLGMILGNTLNGISLGLGRLGDSLAKERDRVEMLLTLGATRWEAALPSIRDAVRTALVPMINAMMVAGLVSLPGMMTGQLLAGVDPVQAVRYQIVIMFLIAAGTALGAIGVVLLGYRRLFSIDHQFLIARLR